MLDLLVQVADGSVARYPYPPGQLRLDYPNTSFPDLITEAMFAEYGVHPVERVDPPAYDPQTHRPEEAAPALVEGRWRQVWQLRAATVEEAADGAAQKSAKAAAEARAALRRELANTLPQQSLPALVDRLVKLERALGIRPLIEP